MFSLGIASGKFGELLQGALPGEDNYFLISVPINRYSIARFRCSNINKGEIIYPSHKIKSVSLAFKIMKYFDLTCGWELKLESNIYEGKGLGSSTADLVACARAIINATEKILPTNVLLSFIKEIEPSDGVMYDGIVCFYHRRVALHSQLGFLPNLTIAGVDEGGVIDTVNFNQNLKLYTSAEKERYADLLEKMFLAIRKNDLNAIGKFSTQSAIFHQNINPKKNLEYLIEICKSVGAAGVVVAHSGTYAGIILDKNCPCYVEQLNFIEKKIKERTLTLEIFHAFVKTSTTVANENVQEIF